MNATPRPSVLHTIGIILLALLPPVLSLVLQALCIVIARPLFGLGMDPNTCIRLQSLIFNGIFAVITGVWYWLAFVRKGGKTPGPKAAGQTSSASAGNRLRKWIVCAVALLFMAVGIQYVAHLAELAVYALFPGMRALYQLISDTSGGAIGLLPVLCLVILGPIGEELAFRGISLHYANRAMPFWLANLLQALLFAALHINLIQGIHCFISGLLLGYLCRRGGGVRYAIPVHIMINAISCFLSDFISNSLLLNLPLFAALSLVLLVLAVWLFRKGTAAGPGPEVGTDA